MPTSFEDAIALLDKLTNPFDFPKVKPNLVEGLHNLASRLHEVEKSRITDMNRMQVIETLTAEEKTELASIAQDRTDLQHRVADLEHLAAAKVIEPTPPVQTAAEPTPSFMDTTKNPIPQASPAA